MENFSKGRDISCTYDKIEPWKLGKGLHLQSPSEAGCNYQVSLEIVREVTEELPNTIKRWKNHMKSVTYNSVTWFTFASLGLMKSEIQHKFRTAKLVKMFRVICKILKKIGPLSTNAITSQFDQILHAKFRPQKFKVREKVPNFKSRKVKASVTPLDKKVWKALVPKRVWCSGSTAFKTKRQLGLKRKIATTDEICDTPFAVFYYNGTMKIPYPAIFVDISKLLDIVKCKTLILKIKRFELEGNSCSMLQFIWAKVFILEYNCRQSNEKSLQMSLFPTSVTSFIPDDI